MMKLRQLFVFATLASLLPLAPAHATTGASCGVFAVGAPLTPQVKRNTAAGQVTVYAQDIGEAQGACVHPQLYDLRGYICVKLQYLNAGVWTDIPDSQSCLGGWTTTVGEIGFAWYTTYTDTTGAYVPYLKRAEAIITLTNSSTTGWLPSPNTWMNRSL